MRAVIAVLFAVAAAINFLPLVGVLSAERLEALYGVSFTDPNLVVLMRHRAVLFGIVAGLLVAAMFRPALRTAAGTAGLVSMGAFLVLGWPPSEFSAALQRVFWVDVAGCVALGMALWLSSRTQKV